MQNFYNNVYRTNPAKWNSEPRDEFAYQAISGVVSDPASLLDFGCGNGHTLRYFMDRWPETEFYGVDISEVALDVTRKKIPSAKLSTTIEDMPKVNVITMLGVMEHLQDITYIQTIAAHLSPAGLLYVEVPNCLSYSSSKEEGFRRTTGGTGQLEWHLKRETWEAVFVGEGLEIVKGFTGKQASWEFVWLLKVA